MAAQDEDVAAELEAQNVAVDAVRSVGLPEPADELMKDYWNGVYNRIETRGGWALVIIGTVLVCAYALYEILTEPSIATLYRVGIAAVVVGFGLLISSVLRQRLKVRPYDKYTEVLR